MGMYVRLDVFVCMKCACLCACVYVNLLRVGELNTKNMEICGEFEYRIEFYPIQMGVNDIYANLFSLTFFLFISFVFFFGCLIQFQAI